MVRCSDGSLYTGITGDKDGIVEELNAGNCAPYTRTRLPVFLVYTEEYMNRKDALCRAEYIRSMNRRGKEQILTMENLSGAKFAFGI